MISMESTIISVGNLSTGGTGKTPMIEYLVRLLKDDHQLATLSRGYGRKTKGYRLAKASDTSELIGDEPLQYFRKYGDQIKVVVSEKRVLGVSSLLLEHPETELFLLDDAYQHRFLQRDLNIMLTAYDRPFFKDWVLPTGDLREPRKEAKRADLIVVTKCPFSLSEKDKAAFENGIDQYNKAATIFFSKVAYADPERILGSAVLQKEVVLLTGIANPKPLVEHLNKDFEIKKHFTFPDHYQFRDKDLDAVKTYAEENNLTNILTTEKDMVRLLSRKGHSLFKKCSLFYVPIESVIDNSEAFDEKVLKALKGKPNL